MPGVRPLIGFAAVAAALTCGCGGGGGGGAAETAGRTLLTHAQADVFVQQVALRPGRIPRWKPPDPDAIPSVRGLWLRRAAIEAYGNAMRNGPGWMCDVAGMVDRAADAMPPEGSIRPLDEVSQKLIALRAQIDYGADHAQAEDFILKVRRLSHYELVTATAAATSNACDLAQSL